MKIKLDENLPPVLSVELTQLGHDVDTAKSEGLGGATDAQLVTAASAAGRLLFTLDLDFEDARQWPTNMRAGIVLFKPRTQGALTIINFVRAFTRSTKLERLATRFTIVEPTRTRTVNLTGRRTK